MKWQETVINDKQLLALSIAFPEGMSAAKECAQKAQAKASWDAAIKEVVKLAVKSDVLCSEKIANKNNCYACKQFYAKLKELLGV